jgi:hypothetical protein
LRLDFPHPLHAQRRPARGNLFKLPSVLHRPSEAVDTEGRVDRFQKKAAKAREMQAQKKAAADAKSARKVQ